jgi:SAM-dependent methyltransferase
MPPRPRTTSTSPEADVAPSSRRPAVPRPRAAEAPIIDDPFVAARGAFGPFDDSLFDQEKPPSSRRAPAPAIPTDTPPPNKAFVVGGAASEPSTTSPDAVLGPIPALTPLPSLGSLEADGLFGSSEPSNAPPSPTTLDATPSEDAAPRRRSRRTIKIPDDSVHAFTPTPAPVAAIIEAALAASGLAASAEPAALTEPEPHIPDPDPEIAPPTALPSVEAQPASPTPIDPPADSFAPRSGLIADNESVVMMMPVQVIGLSERVPSLKPPPPEPESLAPSHPPAAPVSLAAMDVLGDEDDDLAFTPKRLSAPGFETEVEEVEPEHEDGTWASEPKRPPPPPPTKRAEGGPSVPPTADKAPASGAVRRRAAPWWETLFSDAFIPTLDRTSAKVLLRETDFIEQRLGLESGAVILDLGCGTGQHAVELCRRGYSVVGYDLSIAMLARASENANAADQRLHLLQGDMREMAFEEMFDSVVCWSTTFGYFDDEKNLDVLKRIRRSLKQGGVLLLDVTNRDYIAHRAPSLAWFEGEGCKCMDDMQLDFFSSRLKIRRNVMFDDGRSREIDYSIRVYTLHELGRMLREAGFRVTQVSGHPAHPGAFFGAESPRIIVVADRA